MAVGLRPTFALRMLVAAVVASGVVACRDADAASPESAEASGSSEATEGGRTYDAVGVVRGIDRERPSITIQHEDVPGYMPAMTMPFELESVSQVEGIEVGDAVAFTFRVEGGGRHVVVRIAER